MARPGPIHLLLILLILAAAMLAVSSVLSGTGRVCEKSWSPDPAAPAPECTRALAGPAAALLAASCTTGVVAGHLLGGRRPHG